MKIINEIHKAEYEKKPDVIATAPGRFHLIGEHSWFFKDKTLSMAINLPIYVAISKRNDSYLKFYFHQIADRKRSNISSIKYKKEDRWANAIKAIIYGYTSGGFDLGGMDITVHSEILPSAGFGVTTAIKVATLIAIKNLFDVPCTDVQMLQALERANKLFLHQNNYNADNYSALFSKKGTFIVTDHTLNSWENIPFNFEGMKLLLIDASVPRYSVWNEESLFEAENALLLGDLRERKQNVYGGWHYINNVTDVNEELSVVSEDTRRRLLCIMREHNDVLDAVSGIQKGDFSKFARAINHSHESLRDYYDLSCPEIDWILKRVCDIDPKLEDMHNPVSCGRITGKGFGRCVFTFLREGDVEKFMQKLPEYERIFGFHPSCYEVSSADGACIIKN